MILGTTRCCGVLEIMGLSSHYSPMTALRHIAFHFANDEQRINPPFIYFTGVTINNEALKGGDIGHAGTARTDNYGQTFADFIEDNDLGTIVESDEITNWSGNVLKMWIWQVNYPNTRKFVRDNGLYSTKENLHA